MSSPASFRATGFGTSALAGGLFVDFIELAAGPSFGVFVSLIGLAISALDVLSLGVGAGDFM